jgi:hypothetical protein
MAEQDFTKVFGINATQSATEIVIKKADLQITPTATNGTDQLAAAIVRKMSEALNREHWEANAESNVYAETGTETPAFRTIGNNSETLTDIPVTFHFTLPSVQPTIVPDNY